MVAEIEEENEKRQERGEPLVKCPEKINKYLDKDWSDLDQKTFLREIFWNQKNLAKR